MNGGKNDFASRPHPGLDATASAINGAALDGPPRPASATGGGHPRLWAFLDHRTMAEVMAKEGR